MPMTNPQAAKERARAEGYPAFAAFERLALKERARTEFPLGARRNFNHDGYGKWRPVTKRWAAGYAAGLEPLVKLGRYLPLNAPPSPCPECGGKCYWDRADDRGRPVKVPCETCQRTGTIQPDSIEKRIESADPEWLELVEALSDA